MMNKVFAVLVEDELGDNDITLFSTKERAQKEFTRLLEEHFSLFGLGPDDFETKEEYYETINSDWFYDGICYELRVIEMEILD